MDCATAREAISALLDSEDPGTDRGDVEAHLVECAGCRDWRDAAHEVTRRARLQLAGPVPDRAGEVLAAVRGRTRVPRRGLVLLARVTLTGVAAAQLAMAVPCLLFGHDHSAPEHVAHELGAFAAALAVGFAVAAWRPGRALGLRALVGVAALLLVATAGIDLASGRTSISDEAPHLLAVAGWLLVRYLAAVTPPTAEDPRPALARMLRSWPHPRLRYLLRPAATATAPAASAAGWAVPSAAGLVLATELHPHDLPAACGCATGHCACPGCAAPGQLAAG